MVEESKDPTQDEPQPSPTSSGGDVQGYGDPADPPTGGGGTGGGITGSSDADPPAGGGGTGGG